MIPDTEASDREREGSSVRQIARPVDDRDRGYVASITAGRQAKDAYLRTAADGPFRVPLAEPRALRYFAVDEQYRVVVPRLRRPGESGRSLALETSDGRRRMARRVAFLDFDLHDQRLTLTLFSIGPTAPGSLFVPFADATAENRIAVPILAGERLPQ